jgi:hypothetical protein
MAKDPITIRITIAITKAQGKTMHKIYFNHEKLDAYQYADELLSLQNSCY